MCVFVNDSEGTISSLGICLVLSRFGASHLNNRNTEESLVQALKTYRPGGMKRTFLVYVVLSSSDLVP